MKWFTSLTFLEYRYSLRTLESCGSLLEKCDMTVCWKRGYKPVSSYPMKLPGGGIISCGQRFLLKSLACSLNVQGALDGRQGHLRLCLVLVFQCCRSNPSFSHMMIKYSATQAASIKNSLHPAVVTHTSNPSTWKVETGGSPPAWGHPSAYNETLFQKHKTVSSGPRSHQDICWATYTLCHWEI